MTKYGLYYYETRYTTQQDAEGWVYDIFVETPNEFQLVRESSEWFESKQEAIFAAIGHINLLENGEG